MSETQHDLAIWRTRLEESLKLLDEVAETTCECEEVQELQQQSDGRSQFLLMHLVPNRMIVNHGQVASDAICIQCNARRLQQFIRDGGDPSTEVVKDTFEEVVCHVDDFGEVEFTTEHPVEAVRYWANEDK